MASVSQIAGPEEVREGVDQAVIDYFNPKQPGSTDETVSSDELPEVLADIEDIIDCLLSLAPSIRRGTEPKPILNSSPIITESNSQLERDTHLVRTSFPALDSMIVDKLVMAISWRRNLIANWKDAPLKTQELGQSK